MLNKNHALLKTECNYCENISIEDINEKWSGSFIRLIDILKTKKGNIIYVFHFLIFIYMSEFSSKRVILLFYFSLNFLKKRYLFWLKSFSYFKVFSFFLMYVYDSSITNSSLIHFSRLKIFHTRIKVFYTPPFIHRKDSYLVEVNFSCWLVGSEFFIVV